jgi:hypothetical protein
MPRLGGRVLDVQPFWLAYNQRPGVVTGYCRGCPWTWLATWLSAWLSAWLATWLWAWLIWALAFFPARV